MTAQQTLGPWTYVAGDGNACGGISSKTGWICDFVDDPTPANARLIAAAPDLLEALKKCRDMVGHPDNVAFIDAAIAKATGGDARCPLCRYEHGHAIGCKNNPVDKALAAIAKATGETK